MEKSAAAQVIDDDDDDDREPQGKCASKKWKERRQDREREQEMRIDNRIRVKWNQLI